MKFGHLSSLVAMMTLGAIVGGQPAKADDPPTPIVLPQHSTAVPRGAGPSFPVWASSQDAAGTKGGGTVKGQGACGSCWAARVSVTEPEPNVVVAIFTDEDACASITVTQTGGNAWTWDDGTTVYDLYADEPVSDQGIDQDYRRPNGNQVGGFAWSDGSATVTADQNSDGIRDLVIGGEPVLSVSRSWNAATHTTTTTYEGGLVVTTLRRAEQPGTMGWRAILTGAPGHSDPVTATVTQ